MLSRIKNVITTKRVLGFVFIVLNIFRAEILLAAQDISSLVQKTLPGVVVVGAGNGAQNTSLGSGFFVTTKGDVITNYHVVAGMQVFVIKTDKGNIYPAQIRAYDKERDVAILATKVPASECKVIPLASKIPQIGAAVYAIGAPQGLEKSVSDGLVSQIRKIGDMSYLQISCPISQGSSGGPILNNNGEVVGIATLSVTTGQNLNFAVPVTILKPFIEYGKNVDPIQSRSYTPQPSVTQPTSRSVNSSTANFYEVYRDANMLIYTDLNSIEDKGDYVVAWSKYIYRGELLRTRQKEIKNIEYVMRFEAYDKKSAQAQELSFTDYGSNGIPLNTENYQFSNNRYIRIVPGTIGEFLYNFVMR